MEICAPSSSPSTISTRSGSMRRVIPTSASMAAIATTARRSRRARAGSRARFCSMRPPRMAASPLGPARSEHDLDRHGSTVMARAFMG